MVAATVASMRVRLMRKLAEQIDGVDLSSRAVGDVFELDPREAQLLMAEQWAIRERREREVPVAVERRQNTAPGDQVSRFPSDEWRADTA